MNHSRRAPWMTLAVVTAVAALACGGCGSDEAPVASTPAVPQAAPPAQASEVPISPSIPFTLPPPAYTGELPPFPVSPYPAQRPPEVIRAVYTFAARHPEVLHYVPCFCGCQNAGHHDNDDCFIKSRDRNGTPTWEPHGMTWGICLDVARDAMQMHSSGASVSQIRAAIEGKYRSHYDTMTPTSPAPAPGVGRGK